MSQSIPEPTLAGRRVLLIISGGIAAYKSLDLIRRLRERGADVRVVMTQAAQEFVTPLAAAALSENRVYTELFSLTEESEMGHIRLSREADLIVVAPASADLIAKAAVGLAGDLASTVLLATDKPVMMAPAMNVIMWGHPATQANMATLRSRGVRQVGPEAGDLACGEIGSGRMAEPLAIVAAVEAFFGTIGPLAGRRALVTSGPTFEPIDPVRFIGNRSSGKQGHAVAAALHKLGAETILISGPTHEPPPPGVTVVAVETAAEMLAACLAALPADVAVFAAAVADWRADTVAAQKIKKTGEAPPVLQFIENPDILATVAARASDRPALVVGFAAETQDVVAYAQAKRRRKGADWIVANDVSPETGTFGGDLNTVHVITETGVDSWPPATKTDVAARLAARIAAVLGPKSGAPA
jgi:phosphopantothenoylcysteine decarboxylase/phosphopantothenate--cysteine ligase